MACAVFLMPCAIAADAPRDTVRVIPATANVAVESAPVRTQPRDSAPLVGYLAGASPVNIVEAQETNGWVPVTADWGYYDEAWIRRRDVAVTAQFKKDNRQWPVEFVVEYTEIGNYAEFFPKDNRCPDAIPASVMQRIRKSTEYPLKEEISCKEIWHVPGTMLFRASVRHDKLDDDSFYDILWYDSKRHLLYVYTIGDSYTVGYYDGRLVERIVECSEPGRSIACPIYSDLDPSQTIPPTPAGKKK